MIKATPYQLHRAAQTARQTTMMVEQVIDLIQQRKAAYEQSAAIHEAQAERELRNRDETAVAALECLLSEIEEKLHEPQEEEEYRTVEETLPLFVQAAMRTPSTGRFSGRAPR